MVSEIKIRGLEPAVLQKFEQVAQEKGTTRNQVIKNCLTRLALAEEIQETESKYEMLVESLAETIAQNTQVLAEVSQQMERMEALLLEVDSRK